MYKLLVLCSLPATIFAAPPPSTAPAAGGDDATVPEGGGDPYAGAQNVPSSQSASNWVGAPGAQILRPSRDVFYSVNSTLVTNYPHGESIQERPISLAGTYSGIDKAFQMVYSSQDNYGGATSSVADVLIPRKDKLNGNIVAYQIAEDAVNIDCSPSYNLLYKRAIPAIQSLLNEGYVVVVPDYEGVRGSFTVGKVAGRQILDALAATKERVSQLGLYQGDINVGVWGYGTAGWASGWAAEIAEEYFPELKLKVAALGSLPTNLTNWVAAANASPSSSLVVTSLLGLATEYKDVYDVLQDNLTPRHRNFFNSAASHCSTENLVRFFDADIVNNFFIPDYNVLADPKVRDVYEINSLGQKAPKANLFVYQNEKDPSVSIFDVRKTLKFYCSQGVNIKYHEIQGNNRGDSNDMYLDVIDYLGDAFKSDTLSSSCDRINGLE